MRKKSATKENLSFGIVTKASWRLISAKPLLDYELEVKFNDGTHGFVEMKKFIFSNHAGIFAVLKDQALFNKVYLEYGVVTWPGEIDLAPDAMHDAIKQCGRWILQ